MSEPESVAQSPPSGPPTPPPAEAVEAAETAETALPEMEQPTLYGEVVVNLMADADIHEHVYANLEKLVRAHEQAYSERSKTLATLVRLCEEFAAQVDRESHMVEGEARTTMFYVMLYLGMLTTRAKIKGAVLQSGAAIYVYMLSCLCSPEMSVRWED